MTQGYDILKQLGRGGSGDVYLATANGYGRPSRHKFLRDLDADALTRFKREVRLLHEHMDNSFVVDLVVYDLDASLPYIINDAPQVAPAAPAQPTQPFPWKVVTLGGLALLVLPAAGDNKEWDDDVKRYRGRDGRFTSG